MAVKKTKPKRDGKPGESRPRWALAGVAAKGLFALGLVVAAVAGVAWLGDRAGEQVADRPRYTARVADIRCDAPPGTDRAAFLTEVRYLANLPETMQVVDPALRDTLSAAFARHPWVAEVAEVAVEPDGAVSVGLKFRTPVLAVRVSGEADPRVVAKSGVLLPSSAPATGLALLVTKVLPPTRPAGEVWPDPTVTRAAELAELHKPRQIEKTDKGWRLTRDSGPPLIVSW
jgi:hypothetical protein